MKVCGCCSVPGSSTPSLIFNRPGLSAVQYRIGTFGSFREAMIEEISQVTILSGGVSRRPLVNLTARLSSDYGIAVLELWAYVADVLTFYQERSFNEALLRTAILRESVLGLCRLLDYKPAPGAAAETLFAFMIERGKTLQVPIGLRVQSVPGPNEKPQKFETVETQNTAAVLNSFRIFPQPQSYTPLAATSKYVWLANGLKFSPPLVKNDSLVAFQDAGTAGVEEKRVESLQTIDGRLKLEFDPAFRNPFAGGKLFRWTQKLRLFGSQAADHYLSTTPDGTDPRVLLFTSVLTPLTIASSAQDLYLDGVVDSLRIGQRLLLHAPEGQSLIQIKTISQESQSIGPLTATVTKLETEVAIGVAIADLRKVVLYQLSEPEIAFDSLEYGADISGHQIYVHPSDAAGIDTRRILIVDDASLNPRSVTVSSVGSSTGLTVLNLTSALSPPLKQATAIAYGNVVKATHGETIAAEILGSGDASTAFQKFQLAKAPVTQVRTPGAPHGVASTLELRVDNVLWHETPTFYGHGPRERIFTTSRDNSEAMTVLGGDSTTGARFSTGKTNIVAKYRQGLGRVGNVVAGSLRNPLDRPTGLKSVVNPIGAQGGADAETLDQARENAPNTVRTFERAVSLRDFEDSARQFPGIARALAVWQWDGEEQAIRLTVAGDDGAIVSDQLLADLTADFDQRRDPNRKLTIEKHRKVPIRVEAAILANYDFVKELVQNAVATALADHFAFAHNTLGQAVHLSSVYTAIQAVDGVVAADVNRLQFKNSVDTVSHQATSAPLQKHLRILRNEISVIDNASVDIVVTLGLS
jgi:uncharacterized phage protein gp47/JayE